VQLAENQPQKQVQKDSESTYYWKGGSMAFAETFKALSDPVRRRILELLKNERLSAGEIGSHFDMTGATISYHLGILKKADLVLESREKNFIYYELNTSVLEEIMLWISELKGGTSDVEKI
jgi:DNA-binding transcriptional ArsR family regulator